MGAAPPLSGAVQLTLSGPGLFLLRYSGAPFEKQGSNPCLLQGWTQTLWSKHAKSSALRDETEVRTGDWQRAEQSPTAPITSLTPGETIHR